MLKEGSPASSRPPGREPGNSDVELADVGADWGRGGVSPCARPHHRLWEFKYLKVVIRALWDSR